MTLQANDADGEWVISASGKSRRLAVPSQKWKDENIKDVSADTKKEKSLKQILIAKGLLTEADFA